MHRNGPDRRSRNSGGRTHGDPVSHPHPIRFSGIGIGLSLAAVYAPIGAVVGEWVGASRGLGYLMLLANGRAKVDLMFACLFVLAAFTMLLHGLVSYFARKLAAWPKKAA